MKSGMKSKAEMEGIEILDKVTRESLPQQRSLGNQVLRGSRSTEDLVAEAEFRVQREVRHLFLLILFCHVVVWQSLNFFKVVSSVRGPLLPGYTFLFPLLSPHT